jgi:hypothetical protein
MTRQELELKAKEFDSKMKRHTMSSASGGLRVQNFQNTIQNERSK